jgi:hypothetical protein
MLWTASARCTAIETVELHLRLQSLLSFGDEDARLPFAAQILIVERIERLLNLPMHMALVFSNSILRSAIECERQGFGCVLSVCRERLRAVVHSSVCAATVSNTVAPEINSWY